MTTLNGSQRQAHKAEESATTLNGSQRQGPKAEESATTYTLFGSQRQGALLTLVVRK